MGNTRYRVCTPTVVSENIDGEVIAIHLKRGHYYSMQDTAAVMWGWFEAGASNEVLESRLTSLFGTFDGPMRKVVDEFISQLLEEELIETTLESPSVTVSVAPASNGGPRPFLPPLLHRHTDMQDLLVLDPIHDVGEMGWPNPKDS